MGPPATLDSTASTPIITVSSRALSLYQATPDWAENVQQRPLVAVHGTRDGPWRSRSLVRRWKRAGGIRKSVFEPMNLHRRRLGQIERRLMADPNVRCLAVSQMVADEFASHYGRRDGVNVIYNGVDTNEYRPDSQSRERFREKLQINKDELLISFVGRLDYQKNPQMFLKAVETVRKRHGNIKVAIAGDGPEARAVERFLREGNNAQWATWLGFIDEVPALLNASDIFVLPSRWEGFGLSAAEAMATGLPVIATRVPGLTELIIDGKTGLLIESEDVEALILAIEKLIDDEAMRVSLGSAARQRVQEKFSIDMSIVAHEQLYDEILRATR